MLIGVYESWHLVCSVMAANQPSTPSGALFKKEAAYEDEMAFI